jgi:tRNA dimethylallyltransferase
VQLDSSDTKKSKQLIVIEGPTASGKTALGVALAKELRTVIISADSRQFYKEIEIGTAKPTKEEQEGIHHYFVDSHSLEDEISSARYAKEVNEILEIEFKNHDIIVMVGGSGMFIDAVCIGLDNIPKSDEIKIELTQWWEKEGLEPLLNELKDKDPIFFEEVDRENPMRIIRALEAIRITGEPFSKLRTNQKKELSFEVKRFVINHEREKIYDRINRRVDLMIQNGLIDEVKSVQHLQHLSTLKTVGYTELFRHLNGEIDLKMAIDLIKQNTRRYAKRQLTWFRRHDDAVWIDFTSTQEMKEQILLLIPSAH